MNPFALHLIMEFEGCKLEAYRDGGGVLTIGYGHTGVDVTEGLVIKRVKAVSLLMSDLAWFESGVKKAVKVPLNEHQLGALISFSYNVGLDRFIKSTLLKLINENSPKAPNEFLRWTKDDGVIVKGLIRRRKAEQELFTHTSN